MDDETNLLFGKHQKRWLSESQTGATEYGAVAWNVSVTSSYTSASDEFMNVYVTSSFRVNDCSRSVNIDLYYDDLASFLDRRSKLETIISAAQAALDAHNASWEHYVAGKKIPNPRYKPD